MADQSESIVDAQIALEFKDDKQVRTNYAVGNIKSLIEQKNKNIEKAWEKYNCS